MRGRRPILAFGNSDSDMQMIEYTLAGEGRRMGLFVHHTDAERKYAYDRKSKVGTLDKALDVANKNDDGTIDIYFDPTAPNGKEQNWIPTNTGEGWFPYFRLYGPMEAYFDRGWVLPSIEKVK